MRLSKIRIAGFKSFVDPVTLDLRSNLVGILGPNGCGKSNTIDAVRWVMGESSAKHLRGQSMEDVIFNGSSARKPVGVASVELVFDNSDASLGGEYASYSEIAIKRQVSRDGTSKFFLNGTRCRRRDITDIFLGTGLGPRSYAIIEQGTISRLIEAKPEELRTTLEEAAGISRYKDRRRETESRMANTRENLERLSDLRDELDKQLQKLDKQAKAAERFRDLREEERLLEARVIELQLQDLTAQKTNLVEQLRLASDQYQTQLGTVHTLEATVQQLRDQYTEANEQLNNTQGEFYQASAECSRLEQSIQHQHETERHQQETLHRLELDLSQTLQQVEQDRAALLHHETQLAQLEPQVRLAQDQWQQAEQNQQTADADYQHLQERWQQLQQQIAESTRQAQIENSRIEQLDRQLQLDQQRHARLHQELKLLVELQPEDQTATLATEIAVVQALNERTEDQLHTTREQLIQTRQQTQQTQTALEKALAQRQTLQGRLASLETLQQAGLDKSNHAQQQWLQQQGLQQQPRLAELLQLETGWETALETVLRQCLEAVVIDDFATWRQQQQSLPANGLSLLAAEPSVPASHTTALAASHTALPPTLASKIKQPQWLQQWLQHIYCVEDLAAALALLPQLDATATCITRAGLWLGHDWIHCAPSQDAHSGVLQRQQDIRQLGGELKLIEAQIEILHEQAETLRDEALQREQEQHHLQAEVNRLHRKESELSSQWHSTSQRLEQWQQRQIQLSTDSQELEQHQSVQKEALEQATEQRNVALALLESLEQQRQQLSPQREHAHQYAAQTRAQLRQHQEHTHQLQLALENSRTQSHYSRTQLERVQERLQALEQQQLSLTTQLIQAAEPLAALQADLEQACTTRLQVEQRLSVARSLVQHLDQSIRQQDALRMQAEREAAQRRNHQEQLKLAWQTIQVQSQTLEQQLAETELDLLRLTEELVAIDTVSIEQTQQRLAVLSASIKRLGPINLAAIEEYREQYERKHYLDQQYTDLNAALETLEAAIRKIDRETRTRFKETFELVNTRLQAMFPRLFGGGECYLEMTENDWLTTGISIMARPPGKRLSSIYLMSGGEKALTAVALVFAIFELNPAPFCMLDEVDAPLDEANVGRFCALVKHMAERVQFIFITHNKTTMELAENLIGVTMREAGVSRLVSVDVAEAVKLAGV